MEEREQREQNHTHFIIQEKRSREMTYRRKKRERIEILIIEKKGEGGGTVSVASSE